MSGREREALALAANAAAASELSRLLELCQIAVSGITGVGLVVCSDPWGTARMQIAAVGGLTEHAEQLQIDLGEGPCIQAYAINSAVFAPDLGPSPEVADWPTYAQEALSRGIQATFAFPVQVHRQPLGVLALYRNSRGVLTSDQVRQSEIYSTAAGILLLGDAQILTTPSDEDAHARITPAAAAIHQASGMLIARYGLTASAALAYLRAYAYSHGRVLANVAAAVIERRLDPAEEDLP